MDDKEVALRLLHLVEEHYNLDDVIADYKKVLTAVSGTVTTTANTVIGTTGGRKVPIVKQDDIRMKLTEAIQQSGSAVSTSSLQSF
jgi:hypothetical protein